VSPHRLGELNNDLRRRFYAEEVQAVANLETPSLVDALGIVRREQFLSAGPWVIRSEGDFGAKPRWTPSADTCHVYHNVSVGIDASRELFNGAPGIVAPWIGIRDAVLNEAVGKALMRGAFLLSNVFCRTCTHSPHHAGSIADNFAFRFETGTVPTVVAT